MSLPHCPHCKQDKTAPHCGFAQCCWFTCRECTQIFKPEEGLAYA